MCFFPGPEKKVDDTRDCSREVPAPFLHATRGDHPNVPRFFFSAGTTSLLSPGVSVASREETWEKNKKERNIPQLGLLTIG